MTDRTVEVTPFCSDTRAMAPRDKRRLVPDAAIDHWLRASLRKQFDPVVAEPIPAALLAVVGSLPGP